jgi:histidinol dehydrogenase
MLTIYDWQGLSEGARQACLKRPEVTNSQKQKVAEIIARVKAEGDKALLDYSRLWDSVELENLVLDRAKIAAARMDEAALSAIQTAIKTITRFHQSELPEAHQVTTAQGVRIERLYRPIDRVGLYVPGGNNTPLVSSLLMQAIPAMLAGCPIRVLCTPANANAEIDPQLLVAAKLCQIETIYPIGGAQAIAAMAYGTETVLKVDKIFGPGNAFVTEAKAQVAMDPDGALIDMPAGPSEVMIIADDKANPDFIAADLLSQAEHGVDSQVILLCDSMAFGSCVNASLIGLMKALSKRKEILAASLPKGIILSVSSRQDKINIVNTYAPEHLIIHRQDADDWVKDIRNAGTVFLGAWAAEAMGDYVTGSNHVLPTNGYAKSTSGLAVSDFLKSMTIQSIEASGIQSLGKAAYVLANMEGLEAHALAVKLRMDALGMGVSNGDI